MSTESVGRGCLGGRLVLVGRDHRGTLGPQRSRDRPGDRAEPAELANDDAQGPKRLVGGQCFTNRGDSWARAALATEQLEHGNGSWSTDPVGCQSPVALEVLERPNRRRAEDPVGPTTVETELIQPVLERGDVVTAQLWGRQDEQTVAETPSGLDERQPGGLVAVPTDVETTSELKRGDRLGRGHTEVARSVDGDSESRRAQAALQVADRFALLSRCQREVAGQRAVARNSSSSWSRAPLLLAPTSRLDTSPPENTSSVGMLMTL